MTLAAFYALIPGIAQRYRRGCAAAAYQVGDLMFRGLSAGAAITAVSARRDLISALTLAGLNDEFATITGP